MQSASMSDATLQASTSRTCVNSDRRPHDRVHDPTHQRSTCVHRNRAGSHHQNLTTLSSAGFLFFLPEWKPLRSSMFRPCHDGNLLDEHFLKGTK
jgi:hypothetical protein